MIQDFSGYSEFNPDALTMFVNLTLSRKDVFSDRLNVPFSGITMRNKSVPETGTVLRFRVKLFLD